MKKKDPVSELFENDDLDEAVMSADDTGMVAEQHVVAEEEPLIELERRLNEEEK